MVSKNIWFEGIVSPKIEINKIILICTIVLSITLATSWGVIELQRRQKNRAISLNQKLGINQEQSEDLTPLFSQGNQILITADSNLNKLEGVRAYVRGDFEQARDSFLKSLEANSNDPETLIYLNNSKAIAEGNKLLTIAISVPIGGNLGVAQEILRGVAQAQHEFNSNNGLEGKLLKVIIANDNNEPELAVKIAREFTTETEILAVIGHNASDASIAAAPIYQEAGLVMITPTSSANSLPKIGDYIYRVTPSTRDLANLLADYVVNVARKQNIAICVDNHAEATRSFKSDFTWAVYDKGASINRVECDFAAADFNPTKVPAQVISNGADALLLIPSLRYLDRAIQVARANTQLQLFGSHTTYSFTTLQQGQLSVNGMILPVAWFPKPTETNLFIREANKLWGTTGSWRTAMAYDAVQTILRGLELSNNRAQLKQVLDNPSFQAQGVSEPIRFMGSGDRISQGVLVRIEPGEKSGTGYDFVYLDN